MKMNTSNELLLFNALLRHVNNEQATDVAGKKLDAAITELVYKARAGDYESEQILAEAWVKMQKEGWLDA
jgi:hypothetical protein